MWEPWRCPAQMSLQWELTVRRVVSWQPPFAVPSLSTTGSCRSSVPHRLSWQQLSSGGALELVFLPDMRLLSQATLLRGSHLAWDFLRDARLLQALPSQSFFIPLFFPRGQPCITSEGFPWLLPLPLPFTYHRYFPATNLLLFWFHHGIPFASWRIQHYPVFSNHSFVYSSFLYSCSA